ncbi:MAG: glycerophosphodiester phosphodiesterase [Candidatus Nanopelagicales bacterium]
MTATSHPFLSGRQPIALAHRGGAAEATENSPSAFQRAFEMGFRFVETDVRATRDGHAVVFHDARLDRTTDRAGPLAELALRQFARAQLSGGDHPISLAEALRIWPTLHFNVDVKAEDAVVPFLRAVAEADAWARVCAASFSTARLDRMRRLAGPKLATSMGRAEVARLVLGLRDATPACAAQVPRSRGRIPLVTRAFVRRAHIRGVHVHVWTVDDAAVMHDLLDLGVDGIVTDRPSVLREVLLNRGLWD